MKAARNLVPLQGRSRPRLMPVKQSPFPQWAEVWPQAEEGLKFRPHLENASAVIFLSTGEIAYARRGIFPSCPTQRFMKRWASKPFPG